MSDGLVSTKGQVVIPKALRDVFGIKPGSKIRFANENGQLVGHVLPEEVIPSLDVLIAQARILSAPKMADLGDMQGTETIDDGWVGPANVLEMNADDLISAWNAHVQSAKHA
ncbi:MAG: AbrB/MazE/SpoVT family DNA-binding domain-containing protein [Aquidulcibacter sp.]|jgi:AbrB family looped-hinge helix DNA binding protein|uniref:AbrB/MazE/SpoVT family DNA-binding domain-containing protein n=1 Tax=Aquidulcibacter sp. TaxID=2052990 RepID=UPI0022C96899|nr:AbrB/MazE/SpoVT family DNA-binding domain-containing protein [Aquidulcibacter sp.]MCE2890806.1 AbrB/MazE/SpoVT family DNA-binding domain-containing protein [Hyphomonadaceae bacterium]MCZ8209123.1 AbrB/MazE/SpoVT family DNA-binding domain-containing protein [Aquidulcibacter sp.]